MAVKRTPRPKYESSALAEDPTPVVATKAQKAPSKTQKAIGAKQGRGAAQEAGNAILASEATPPVALTEGQAPAIGTPFVVGSNAEDTVKGWLKKVPIQRPRPSGCGLVNEVLNLEFNERYREPETEYRFTWVVQGEATHIHGQQGGVYDLAEIRVTGESKLPPNVAVAKTRLAQRLIGQVMNHDFSTLPWKPRTLAEALERLPDLADALAKDRGQTWFYVHTNGCTVRGRKTPTDAERWAGRTTPDQIEVEVAERDEVPTFAREWK